TGSRDGGVPSQFKKSSTISLSPIYIKIRVNKQPTDAIADMGSARSIIHSQFLKIIPYNSFNYQTRQRQTAKRYTS
ncbi:unnamed protein product, partial [Rotaria magnacalcarata]